MRKYLVFFVVAILASTLVLSGCTKTPEEKRAAYLSSAKDYYEQEKYAEAAIQYQNALQIASDDVETILSLGQVQLKLKRVNEAYKNFHMAAKIDQTSVNARENLAAIELLANKYDLSKEHASQILELEPANLKAKEILAQSLYLSGSREEAVTIMKEIVEAQEPSEGIIINTIQMYLGTGNIDEAMELISRGISIYPDSTKIRFLASDIYVYMKDIESAKKWAEEAYSVAGDNMSVGITLARFYAGQKMYDLLDTQIASLKEKFPEEAEPYMLEAAAHNQKGDVDSAIKAAKKAQGYDDTTQSRTLVSQLLIEKGDIDAAVDILEKTVEDDNKAIPPRILLARIYLDKKEPDKALKVINLLIEKIALRPDIAGIASQAYLMKGDSAKAKEFAENSLRENPRNVSLHIMKAKIHFARHEHKEALNETEILAQNSINTPDILYIGAISSLKTSDAAKADLYVKKLKVAIPDKWISLHAEALLYLINKDAEKAFKVADKAITLYPENTEALRLYTGLAPKAISRDEAIKKIEDVCSKSSKSYCHVVLASMLEGEGKKDEALKQIQTAIDIDPDQIGLYHALAQFYARNSMMKKAIDEYESILNKRPDDLRAATTLALLYQNKDKLTDAKKVYSYILDKDPKHAIASNNLAWILAEGGKKNELNKALELARIAKDQFPEDPKIADTLGYIYLKKGLYDNALAQFSLSAEKLPDEPTINYHMALALVENERGDQAVKYLKKALETEKAFPEKDLVKGLLSELESAKK